MLQLVAVFTEILFLWPNLTLLFENANQKCFERTTTRLIFALINLKKNMRAIPLRSALVGANIINMENGLHNIGIKMSDRCIIKWFRFVLFYPQIVSGVRQSVISWVVEPQALEICERAFLALVTKALLPCAMVVRSFDDDAIGGWGTPRPGLGFRPKS